MASITIRGNAYYACWRQFGKSVQKSTGISVNEPGMSPANAKKYAKQTADNMERAAKGLTTARAAMDAIRSAAAAMGCSEGMMTVEEYLRDFQKSAGEKTESNRRRAFNVFLEFLGAQSRMRLDALTPKIFRDFFAWALKKWAVGTVGLFRTNLAAAFNRAVEEDILLKSPMPKNINLAKESLKVNPGDIPSTGKRQPFTPEELQIIMTRFPRPWCDMVATSFFTGGQRLGDVCCLKWDAIDWEKGIITIKTQKTAHPLEIPIVPMLAERLEIMKREQGGGGIYVFPEMARRYLNNVGSISTEFTTQLRVWGIIPPHPQGSPLKGKRKYVSPKSFHSIRHSVVSFGRADARMTPDLMRAVVGHDSEEIERSYFTASLDQKRTALTNLAALVTPSEPAKIPATPGEYIGAS